MLAPYTQLPPFHSQWGEDRWLAAHYDVPASGVFVDVGAGDGFRGSNTLYFENLGWQGLCIDADPRNHDPLRNRRCAVETCAVASDPGVRPFGMYGHRPSRSGLTRHGSDYHEILVECRRLGALLTQWRIDQIDLLSIDVEGTETEVWQSFDHVRHRPTVVIIEFDDEHSERRSNVIHDQLGRDVYRLVHTTPANMILLRTDRPWGLRR
jgi:FkbM family methyltransferase